MQVERTRDIRIVLPRAALAEVFDECDRYDCDETGGRILGTYASHGGQLAMRVTGIIGPGPRARRTATSFFQDGESQERIFRQVEKLHPRTEHLGNWHTHHVNGYPTLSGGDIATYRRTVNHWKHNIPIFYALLVVAKNHRPDPDNRYLVKHFVLLRGDEHVYEVHSDAVELIDTALVWPDSRPQKQSISTAVSLHPPTSKLERVYDRDILSEFFRGLRPYSSPRLGVYWRGPVELIDGSQAEVMVLESAGDSQPAYSVALREPPRPLKAIAEELAQREFPSARAALITAERICNRELYKHLQHPKHPDVVQEQE